MAEKMKKQMKNFFFFFPKRIHKADLSYLVPMSTITMVQKEIKTENKRITVIVIHHATASLKTVFVVSLFSLASHVFICMCEKKHGST